MNNRPSRDAPATWSRTFGTAACVAIGWIILTVQPVQAQLAYDGTVFLHGGNSAPGVWLRASSPTRLGELIVLGPNGYRAPDLLGRTTVASQSGNLRDSLNAYTGQNALVAHSMGGLVARATYLNNPANIAGIVTVASPHQGMPIANNFALIEGFALAAQSRVDNAWTAVGALTLGINFLIQGRRLPLEAITTFTANGNSDALQDLRVGSSTIDNLNSYTGDQPARANVYGTIPHRHAAFRVGLSSEGRDADFNDMVGDRNKLLNVFMACKFVGYFSIVAHAVGRSCSHGEKALKRVDERWSRYTTEIGTSHLTQQRPFDGLVPNERSVYPGLSFSDTRRNFQANMVNHSNITYSSGGVQQIANAMAAIGMQRMPLAPVAAFIEGPNVFYSGELRYVGSASGGDGNYAYSWYYRDYGSGVWNYLGCCQQVWRYVSSTTSGFTLRLDVQSGSDVNSAFMSVNNGHGGVGSPDPY
ncbi:MAG: alpha/beta fold hydrolase [Gemmatimonadaceae bacterium]